MEVKNIMSDYIRLNFDISSQFRDKIRQQAKSYGMTTAQYCRMVLMQAIETGGDLHVRENSHNTNPM